MAHLAPADGVDPEAHYALAASRLELDEAADTQATERLLDLIADRDPARLVDPTALRARFEGRQCTVLAPARHGIEQARARPAGTPLIVAGSAVAGAFMHELHPLLVVTDLDGDAAAHRGFSRRGIPMAVHAHGDNIDLLETLVPQLQGPVLGTCQTTPPAPVDTAAGELTLHRTGGFTDGDRACFLAAALGASQVHLAGWDLTGEEDRLDEGKRVKLGIASQLLEQLPVDVVQPDDGDL